MYTYKAEKSGPNEKTFMGIHFFATHTLLY